MNVTNPPKATPHSDLDGVRQDARPNVKTAAKLGQDSGDVEHAKKESVGRPPLSSDREKGDDRTR